MSVGAKTQASSPGGSYMFYGTLAARPAFGVLNRYYWATDIFVMFRDTGAAWEVVAGRPFRRLLKGFFYHEGVTFALFAVAGRVFMHPLEVPFTMTADRIGYRIASTCAGNIRVGIYADNGDTPVGAVLIVQSASVAKPGINQYHEVTIPDTQLRPGLYWLAIQSDEVTTEVDMSWFAGSSGITLRAGFYDHAYGAFTSPCPALFYSQTVSLYLRVKSMP